MHFGFKKLLDGDNGCGSTSIMRIRENWAARLVYILIGLSCTLALVLHRIDVSLDDIELVA